MRAPIGSTATAPKTLTLEGRSGLGHDGAMTGLAAATAVTTTGDGAYGAELSPDWEVWGPQGGYLASVALRAAGVAVGRARPASINAHFVGAGASGPVDISVIVNRATKVGTSATVRVTQPSDRGERMLLTALVWGVDDELPGLEHQVDTHPIEDMQPDGLPNMATLMAGFGGPPHPFWNNLEQRPLNWIEDWENRPARDPLVHCWFRFVDGETHDDPWLDACRSLVVLDLEGWGAATRPHVGVLEHFAPTIELSCRFLGSTHHDVWLLSDARAPVARHGLVAHTGEIWTQDGRLVATGGSTLLCRPAARRPDGR
jgi:acyl-CoA thioesterase-2